MILFSLPKPVYERDRAAVCGKPTKFTSSHGQFCMSQFSLEQINEFAQQVCKVSAHDLLLNQQVPVTAGQLLAGLVQVRTVAEGERLVLRNRNFFSLYGIAGPHTSLPARTVCRSRREFAYLAAVFVEVTAQHMCCRSCCFRPATCRGSSFQCCSSIDAQQASRFSR